MMANFTFIFARKEMKMLQSREQPISDRPQISSKFANSKYLQIRSLALRLDCQICNKNIAALSKQHHRKI
ncbi:hypothetical protein [Chamaesiphon polymorphus]|uniref:Uncharacterized protein n=1 Tax=Chamaesiphon polymorphus CCALA 037 TaxID=2107692 RepID=A0A2T1GKS4_9CYAN|nr:hypothetical protein [Chamaesiphon polymorphus]PSB58435.1 hypothetical protein C7B77_04705 [Chamaesiphon polymorphus CCALA 037]